MEITAHGASSWLSAVWRNQSVTLIEMYKLKGYRITIDKQAKDYYGGGDGEATQRESGILISKI